MKRLITISFIVVIFFSISCRKKWERTATSGEVSDSHNFASERATVARGKVTLPLESVKQFPANRNTRPALAGLDDSEFFKPMVRCPVGERGFNNAIDSLTNARRKPLRNALFHYSIGENQFITKHWNEAILAFDEAKELSGEESSIFRDLLDFKIMLCVAGLGMDDKFDQLASVNLAAHRSPLSAYTKAAKEFYAGNESGAKDALATVTGGFPDPEIRAPWEDAMAEFGYTLPENE